MASKEVKEIVKQEGTKTVPFWGEMEKGLNEFFRRPLSLFNLPGSRFPETGELIPTVDLFESDGDVVLKAELPGIRKEDLDITLTEDTITLAGEKKKEEKIKKKDYYRWESSYGSFCRTFSLPAEVKTDQIKTKFKDGILEIRMPKTEEAKKKEIKVKVE